MLVVALVLTLLRPSVEMDNLDGGRLVVVLTGIILCDSALGGLLPPPLPADGDSEAYETGRKDDGAEGLELCFRSLSLSRGGEGDGESSIMSTHPDVSAAGVRLIPATTSKLASSSPLDSFLTSSTRPTTASRPETPPPPIAILAPSLRREFRDVSPPALPNGQLAKRETYRK